jgi:hypothetical protein
VAESICSNPHTNMQMGSCDTVAQLYTVTCQKLKKPHEPTSTVEKLYHSVGCSVYLTMNQKMLIVLVKCLSHGVK